jgi:hypothetical protein
MSISMEMTMEINKKIELEKIKHEQELSKYNTLIESSKKKKQPFLKRLFKTKAQKLQDKIDKENSVHETKIKELEYNQKLKELNSKRNLTVDIKKDGTINIGREKELKHYDISRKYKWHDLRNISQFKKMNNDAKVLLINMELNNGFFRSFFVNESNSSFDWDKKTYIIDLALKYYNIDNNYWCLDYHESFSIPIRRKFDIQGIQAAIESSGLYPCETATNPSNVSTFMKSNIIEQVIKGAELSKWLQAMRIMIFVILVIVIITLILFVIKSGMLEGVASMFKPKA